MKYKILFRLYDKKMQAFIEANSTEQAEYKLRGKIIIDHISEVEPQKPEMPEIFKDIFGGFK
jgi:hypothetical protein